MTPATPSNRNPRYAAIDLGTNTCLLLAVEWDGKELHPLARELRVVRLGERLEQSGRLSEAALERAVAAFREYREIILAHKCQAVRCVATSAFREAANRNQLHQRIKATTGYEIEEISGGEEARLVHLAVRQAFPSSSGLRAGVDVGGGSTEIILEEDGRLTGARSLPLGSVRLTERHVYNDPPTAGEVAAARADIETGLAAWKSSRNPDALIGVGGTATTLAAMHLELEPYDPDRVHGLILSRSDLEALLERCLALPYAERVKFPGLHPGRADVITAGTMILLAVMDRAHCAEMVVCDRGLRWGVVADMVRRAADQDTAPPTGGTL